MTDVELVRKRLVIIERCVAEIRTLARFDLITTDVREERFVEYSLQIAAQAAIDVAVHIISNDRLGEPDSYAKAFDLLQRHGWIRPDQIAVLKQVAGFRNVLVHGYADVDVEKVREIAQHHLGDLLEFVRVIRERLAAGGE